MAGESTASSRSPWSGTQAVVSEDELRGELIRIRASLASCEGELVEARGEAVQARAAVDAAMQNEQCRARGTLQ